MKEKKIEEINEIKNRKTVEEKPITPKASF